ncbi:MAG: hypothetical protein E6J87_19180 [Deltaproteobacteria bacterium]|nr:MAG: hypothetical protein E6J87_19180 [Deltaproteobacteria bacterium]
MEIADLAHVPVEGVLRVLNGDPVGSLIASRVQKAIDALGAPHEAVVQNMNVLAPAPSPRVGEIIDRPGEQQPEIEETVASARDQLIDSINHATAELEARLPEGVGSVVYEAVRVEVQPVAQHIGQMGSLVEELCRVIERVESNVMFERQARLDDIKLLTDMIVTGWQTVDRRLARVERMLERFESPNGHHQ